MFPLETQHFVGKLFRHSDLRKGRGWGWEFFSRGNTTQHGRNFCGGGADIPSMFLYLIIDFLVTGLKRGKVKKTKYLLKYHLGGVKTGKYEKPAYHQTQN